MLTSQDVRSVQFEKNLRGYRTEEVDRFLDKVEEQLRQDDALAEELRKQIADLTAENQRLHEEMKNYEADGDMLKSALINAQRMGENVIREANQKAEEIIHRANLRGDRLGEPCLRTAFCGHHVPFDDASVRARAGYLRRVDAFLRRQLARSGRYRSTCHYGRLRSCRSGLLRLFLGFCRRLCLGAALCRSGSVRGELRERLSRVADDHDIGQHRDFIVVFEEAREYGAFEFGFQIRRHRDRKSTRLNSSHRL